MADGGSALPLILIELVLVMGGVLAFGIWQIRSVRRDRERAAAERARQATQDQAAATRHAPPDPPPDPPPDRPPDLPPRAG